MLCGGTALFRGVLCVGLCRDHRGFLIAHAVILRRARCRSGSTVSGGVRHSGLIAGGHTAAGHTTSGKVILHQKQHGHARGGCRHLAPRLLFRPGLRCFRHSGHHVFRKIRRKLRILLRGERRPEGHCVCHIGPTVRAVRQMRPHLGGLLRRCLSVQKGVQQGGVFMDIHFTAPFLFVWTQRNQKSSHVLSKIPAAVFVPG